MSPVHAASRATAIVAGLSGGVLTWLFHSNSGSVAVLFGLSFGALSALVAYALVYRVARLRFENKTPVLGAMRGAALSVATFLIAVLSHTVFFPGQGGFLVSLGPVLFISLAMFGWGVAIIGAFVGAFCERRYFA